MRIAILALGTRGDVQPYVALGGGLQAAGHEVRLLTHQDFEGLVRAHGLAFWPARGSVQAVAESPEMRELLARGISSPSPPAPRRKRSARRSSGLRMAWPPARASI